MEIKRNITTKNFDSGSINRIKYIVVHFTANNGDTALGNTNYFKSYRGSSAHYFVDENSVYQSIEDKNIAWHCGAKKYKHSTCRNSNSLGVELCSRKDSKGNYYFMDKTVDNAVELVKMLMAKYNVPATNVIRHYDVTGKVCPEPFVRDVKAWNNFKARLVTTEGDTEMVSETRIKVNGKDIKINRIFKDGKNYIDLRGLEAVGFIVGFNADTKLPILENKISELQINVDENEKSVEAVNIKGYNYVKLRDLADVLGKDVSMVNGGIVIR